MKLMTRKNDMFKKNPLILYTCLFLLFAILIHCVFAGSGMSYVRKTDGYAQHLPVLAYIGEYIRSYVHQVISGGGIIPPMFDTGLIQGADVLGTLHYYGLLEPLNWIVALVPVRQVEMLYGILLYVRLYLAGAAFILYAGYIRKKDNVSPWVFVCGGLMYAFCGYCTFVGFRHPFFTTAAVMLPLILYGVEQYIRENRVRVFIGSIALSCVMNFYFAYINSVLMALYVLVRLCCGKELAWKKRICKLLKLIGAYLIGIGISAFSFLPAVIAFWSNARGAESENDISSLFVYSIYYYANVLYRYITPSGALGYWTCLGFAVIAVPCIVLLCCRVWNREKRTGENVHIFVGWVLTTIMILLPVFGKVLNGFAYISNRWTYGYALVVSLVVVYMLPEILTAVKKEKVFMVSACLAFVLYITVMQYHLIGRLDTPDYIAVLVILVVTAALIVISHSDITPRKIFLRRAMYGVVVLNLMLNVYYVFAPDYGGYVNEFLPKGTAVAHIENQGISSYGDVEEDTFYRMDSNSDIANSALMFDYNGTGGYYSVISEDFLAYYRDLGISGLDRSSVLQGFDRNLILNSLSGTRYIQTTRKKEGKQLYGYEYVASTVNQKGEKTYLFENQNFLPLGFVYTRCMSEEQFYEYSPMERQMLLTETVVLDKAPEALTSEDTSLSLVNQAVYSKVSVDGGKGTSFNEKRKEVHVKKKKSSAVLEFESKPDSLVFLVINGLKGVEDEQYDYTESVAYTKVNKVKHKIFIGAPTDVAYIEKKSIVVPLGYFEDILTTCELQFNKKGRYTYDSMEIVSVPVDVYEENIAALGTGTMQNTKIDNNTITGNITTETDGVILLSIPYSSGWRAYVDGEEVPIQKANLTYMGIELKPGNHEIRLDYYTPGLKAGIVISVLSLVAGLLLSFAQHRFTGGEVL